MRQPLLQRAPRGQASVMTRSVPAPVGGWNTRDPEAKMSPTDAVWLENWWPTANEVQLRPGVETFATGLSLAVDSLMGYSAPAAAKLFAATSAGIYDVTAGGAVGAAEIALTNGRLSHAIMTTVAGTFLIAVNGVDTLKLYDGTSWASITGVSSPAITGVTTSDLDFVHVHARRVWFIEKNSMSVWYLPVDSIAGAATEFPVGQLFTKGGKLAAIGSWTVDGGQGPEDFFLLLTTEGECAIYQGTDPSSSTTWSLRGVFFVGRPVGRKPLVKFGGDVLVLTEAGDFPLSKVLLSNTLDAKAAISDKINNVFNASAKLYSGNFGWQQIVFPTEQLLLVNVPTLEGSSSSQFAMNTLTKAWALFTGWNAFSWEAWQGGLYYGGAGVVNKAMTGQNDFGNNISAFAKTAFNYFGSAKNKQWTLVRPIIRASGNISAFLGGDVDFENLSDSGAQLFSSPLNYEWGAAIWGEALWGADYAVRKEWHTIAAKEGFCLALRLRLAVKNVRVGWSSTDFAFKRGGVL